MPKVGYTIHWNRNRVVSSTKHRDSHSPHVRQDGRGQQFDSACSLISAPSGTVGPVVDHHEFTGQQNTACESRPGYLKPCH